MSAKKTPKRILLADDDPDILEMVTLILKSEGYEVTAAESQKAAEEVLLQGTPDLAIFDLMMEEKDSGFVLAHYLKKLYPDTPVILLSAVTATTGISFATQDAEARAWTKVDKVLDKPVRPEQIKAEVRRLLKEPNATAAGVRHH